MKIAMPTNRIATIAAAATIAAQIVMVSARRYSSRTEASRLSNTIAPVSPTQRRQAAPNRNPMPATIASVA